MNRLPYINGATSRHAMIGVHFMEKNFNILCVICENIKIIHGYHVIYFVEADYQLNCFFFLSIIYISYQFFVYSCLYSALFFVVRFAAL